jgi:aminoglycoside/choline kinase family phosphotransferase
VHRHLESFDGDLPVLVGPLSDIEAALRISDDPVLHRAAERLVPEALGWPRRPLHGDAHTGNLLSSRDGYLWLDFEDACLGPLEWDFASRTVSDDAIAAYPAALDSHLLQRCRQLRRLQVLAAVLTDDLQPDAIRLRDELTAALAGEVA